MNNKVPFSQQNSLDVYCNKISFYGVVYAVRTAAKCQKAWLQTAVGVFNRHIASAAVLFSSKTKPKIRKSMSRRKRLLN